MDKKLSFRRRLIFFIVIAVIYGVLFAMLCSTGFYNAAGAHNDRLFSADDVYYVTEFFSTEIDDSPRIIKHPLLIAFGCLFTRAERLVFGEISLKHHYELIVAMQMCASVAATVFLDMILEKQYRLKTLNALAMCGIFALGFSTLFFTFVAESFILSSLVLLMTFWFARRQNTVVTVLLGVLAAGVTITNALLWAIIVMLSGGKLKRRLSILASAGMLFLITAAILPIRGVFFTTLISGALRSARSYSDHFGFIEVLVRVFFAFCGSPLFYLHTANESAFGEFSGDALSFTASASVPVIIMGMIWFAAVVFALVKCRRNPLIWAALGVIAANLLLHGVMQYGLKEAFLYSLHHLSSQILLVSALLGEDAPEKQQKIGGYCAAGFALLMVLVNIPGYMELAGFLMR